MNIIGSKFFWVILILIVFYLGIIFSVSFFQSRLIYFPYREIETNPNDSGLSYEDITFKSEDKVKLSGWFIPAEKSRGVIIFCHGNAGNISHRMESIKIFYNLGFSVFIFDYRGYGLSEGKPTEKGTYSDAHAAWNYLIKERNIKPEDIIVFGRSLGGAVASWLAQNKKVKALILESSFTSIQDVAADFYPYLPVRLLSRFDYKTLDYIKKITCPVLIIHSPDDEIISFKYGRRLFEAAKEPKDFLKIRGSHNDGFLISGKEYEDGLGLFLSKYSNDENLNSNTK